MSELEFNKKRNRCILLFVALFLRNPVLVAVFRDGEQGLCF